MSKDQQSTKNQDSPPLREHVFDGIQEYDNKLPNWWLFTFYIAIAFYIGYWVIYYNTNWLKSPTENIDARLAAIEKAKSEELKAMLDQLDDSVLIEWSKNTEITSQGEATYKQFCIACHSPGLNGGVIGRSLIDEHWEYGGKPMEIFNLILKGSPADGKGFNGQKMQAWEAVLGPEKTAQVTAYIIRVSPHVEKSE